MAASPHAGTHTEPRFVRKIQQKSHRNVALRFRTSAPSAPAKSIVYVTRPRAKCRRWVMVGIIGGRRLRPCPIGGNGDRCKRDEQHPRDLHGAVLCSEASCH